MSATVYGSAGIRWLPFRHHCTVTAELSPLCRARTFQNPTHGGLLNFSALSRRLRCFRTVTFTLAPNEVQQFSTCLFPPGDETVTVFCYTLLSCLPVAPERCRNGITIQLLSQSYHNVIECCLQATRLSGLLAEVWHTLADESAVEAGRPRVLLFPACKAVAEARGLQNLYEHLEVRRGCVSCRLAMF